MISAEIRTLRTALQDDIIQNQKISRKMKIISLLMFAVGIGLCLLWYDWKLAAIMFLLLWSNNLGQREGQ